MATLDAYQQAAVLAEKNTVVTDGAGSGKTTVLAERFFHLIVSGRARVDGILSLTFTRKAAAEMYERIYRLLIQRLDGEEDRQRRERISAAVAEFDGAHISTLDSFCSQIVRGAGARFGISGDFREDEYSAAQMVDERALSFLLEHSDNSALEQFSADFGTKAVLEKLLKPLAKKEFHLAVEYDFVDMLDRRCKHMREQACIIAGKMEHVNDWFLHSDLPDKSSVRKTREKLTPLSSPVSAVKEEKWEVLSDICGVKISKPGGAIKDPMLLEAKEKIGEWQEATKELAPILMLFQNEELYRRQYSLLNDFQREINSAKRSSGVLTFRDVVEMAVKLLQEDIQLRTYYKGLFSHIMIDEFQDNNDVQRRLLFLLAEKKELSRADEPPAPEELESGKLFFVGDEKQSIYRFRGADVRVLKQLQRQLEVSGGESLQLPNNYRSHCGLIRFFNSLFAEVMKPEDGLTEGGPSPGMGFEAEFVPLEAPVEHKAFTPTVRVMYKPYKESKEEEGRESSGSLESTEPSEEPLSPDQEQLHSKEAEAWHIVHFIMDVIGAGRLQVRDASLGPDSGKRAATRRATYDDVAILMRSSGNQINLERYMRHLQIPYVVQSTRSLFLEAPINDIYQFLQLVLYPEDMHAYAALLRSPFVNLSDDVVARILLQKQEPGPDTAEEKGAIRAFSLFGDEGIFGDATEGEKYKQAKKIYQVLQELSRTAPIEDMIRYLWYEAGYRYVVLRNPDYHAYLEFYDSLVELARRSDRRGEGLATFLDFLRENLGQFEKLEDIEIIPRRTGGVNLLSIHKSKGLEFPIVIVADMGNSGLSGGDGNLYVWDETFGPALSGGESGSKIKSYFAQSAKEEEEFQDYAELKRLLYVACTRAEDHLILSGYHHGKNRNLEKSSGKNVLLNITLSALGWDGSGPAEELMGDTGWELEIIPDVTEEVIKGSRSASGARSLSSAERLFDSAPVVERSYFRRELTAVEINRRYQERTAEDANQSYQEWTAEKSGDTGEAVKKTEVIKKAEAGPKPNRNAISKPSRDSSREAGPEELPAIAIDSLLSEKNGAAAFGELVHGYIENELTRRQALVQGEVQGEIQGLGDAHSEGEREGESEEESQGEREAWGPMQVPMQVQIPPLFASLGPEQALEVEREARQLADAFLSSPLGQEALSAVTETELPFLLLLDGRDERQGEAVEYLVKGQIDLLLQRRDEVLIIDFKTDRVCRPSEYAAQMAVYRRAAEELYGLPARSMLVYVRGCRVEEISIPVDVEALCSNV